ncbi:MAG: hypothetical protein ACR2JO_14650 [Mycobacteriales bacterium]
MYQSVRRTNIYLGERQLDLLRRFGAQRDEPVAGLVRRVVDEWLARRGARALGKDEWQQRVDTLIARRATVARTGHVDAERVAADVADAVAEVRAERACAHGR